MSREHRYRLTVTWTGDRGGGTASYRAYNRSYVIQEVNFPVRHTPQVIVAASAATT